MQATSRISREKGFTLIELLVVIAIISILSSVVIAGMNSARIRARDVQRISDIKQILGALEVFFAEHGHYPGPTTEGVSTSGEFVGDDNGPIEVALRPYLPNMPKDPSHDGSVYFYAYDPQHCSDMVHGSCACDGSSVVAVSINHFEGTSIPISRDTCSGPDKNINQADYNSIVIPFGP